MSRQDTAPPHPAMATNPEMDRIIVNGETLVVPFPSTLAEFLAARGLPLRRVVVEHNGDAVAPSEFADRPLRPGDRLEIITIVAGG